MMTKMQKVTIPTTGVMNFGIANQDGGGAGVASAVVGDGVAAAKFSTSTGRSIRGATGGVYGATCGLAMGGGGGDIGDGTATVDSHVGRDPREG